MSALRQRSAAGAGASADRTGSLIGSSALGGRQALEGAGRRGVGGGGAARPSWEGLLARMAGAAYDHLAFTLVCLPLVSAVFAPHEADMRVLGSGAILCPDTCTALVLLLLQRLVVPVFFQWQLASGSTKGLSPPGRVGTGIGAFRLTINAAWTWAILYYFPHKRALAALIILGAVWRWCSLFLPAVWPDGLSSGICSCLIAALLNVLTLGVFRHMGLSVAAHNCRAASISDVCSVSSASAAMRCCSYELSAQTCVVAAAALMQGLASHLPVPRVSVSRRQRLQQAMGGMMSSSLSSGVSGMILTLALIVLSSRSVPARQALLELPELVLDWTDPICPSPAASSVSGGPGIAPGFAASAAKVSVGAPRPQPEDISLPIDVSTHTYARRTRWAMSLLGIDGGGGQKQGAGLQGWAVVVWIVMQTPCLVLIGSLVTLHQLLSLELGVVWFTQDFPFSDERQGRMDLRVGPLLEALWALDASPRRHGLACRHGLMHLHFMRVLLFDQVDRMAHDTTSLAWLLEPSCGLLCQDLIAKHTEVLTQLEVALRSLVRQSQDERHLSQQHAQKRKAFQMPGQDLVLESLAVVLSAVGVRAPAGGLFGRQSWLSAQLSATLASSDMHVACLHSLASILVESQKRLRRSGGRALPLDERGVCTSLVASTLCLLIGLAVVLEDLVATDCYVAPRVKAGLSGNQLVRPQLANLAAALHLSTYRIVVAFYPVLPHVLSSGDAQAALWIPSSSAPGRDWHEVYLPRIRSFLSFHTAVLPAGAVYEVGG